MKAALRFLLVMLMAWAGVAHADDTAQPAADAAPAIVVRVLTNSFVLPAKFRALDPLAAEEGVRLEAVDVTSVDPGRRLWLDGADLVILDVPRPSDRAQVEEAVNGRSGASATPRITIGGGRPAWENIEPGIAARLAGYYAAGGEANFRTFFKVVAAWKRGGDPLGFPAAVRGLPTGFYRPDASKPFSSAAELLEWGSTRWAQARGRVAFLIHGGVVTDLQTGVVDMLVRRSEAAGLVPIVFWTEGGDAEAIKTALAGSGADALVNMTHIQGGDARTAEFRKLDIPVLQTIAFRDGGVEAWREAASGVPARTASIFLSQAESLGMIDPIVLTAVENGEAVPLPGQVEALIGKLRSIVDLRRTPAADKRLAVLFWNYPAGADNLSASNLNVPGSIETITRGLAEAGYDVDPIDEAGMIAAAKTLLAALYRKVPLEDLLAEDMAAAFPVADYMDWLRGLPADIQHQLSHTGDPAKHWAVKTIDGVPSFVLPRIQRGKLVIMPQMPRSGQAGAHYHDTASPPDHLYLVAYLYLQKTFGADAIIHLGTHGTQEWLPGKDRGLAADDYPFLAVGGTPVIYPYIQDNVGEAIQAKRRGRAVIISHQTPPFAPAGLYDELRDMHQLVHEYQQLDTGAARDRTEVAIREAAVKANMHADLGWTAERMAADFPGFLPVLHDHLHELARQAMPLGLHRFGLPADPDHRLATVMQQLGEPFYDALGTDAQEVFSGDYEKLRETAPFKTLRAILREGRDTSTFDERLRPFLKRAEELDRSLAATGEMEALLAALEGRFTAPGPGGDPIRNPGIRSGTNLYAFEPNKIPTAAAYDAGGEAFGQLVAAFRQEHNGADPTKLAFSLWSSEAIRHLGVTEAQILHAIGARPVWGPGGQLTGLDIIPASELGRPRVDVVVQVTGVYRDQFDGFLRLLADAIARIGALDETGNAVAAGTDRVRQLLESKGLAAEEARRSAADRIFSDAPGSYGSGVPEMALKSASWTNDSDLAERFLNGTQYAYGTEEWGRRTAAANLFAEQLKGTQAAVMSRSSNLQGVLSSDHPFEFLGGLSLAIRHLDGKAPGLYISDLRSGDTSTTTLNRFLSDELRTRSLNPQWIKAMQGEGYAGTLAMLTQVNNFFGWQVVDPSVVRADQWQALFDTYVADARELDLNRFFEAHNAAAQAQLMERMIEAVRKDYWDASEETRRQLVERWRDLEANYGVSIGEPVTRAFIDAMAAGFGLAAADAPSVPANPAQAAVSPSDAQTAASDVPQAVQGQEMQEIAGPPVEADENRHVQFALAGLLILLVTGMGLELRRNAALV